MKIIGIDVSFGQCTIAAVKDGKVSVIGSFAAKEYSEEVLGAVKSLASALLGDSEIQAVVALPSWRTPRDIAAVSRYARNSGMEIFKTIYKSYAAVLGYGYTTKDEGTICALCKTDGGYDFSVVEVDDGVYTSGAIIGNSSCSEGQEKGLADECKKAIETSGFGTQMGKILVYGQCSQECHNELYKIFPVEVARPDVIAIGAAVRGAAAQCEGDCKDLLTIEGLAVGIGIEVGNRECHYIIPKYTNIPTNKTIKVRAVDEYARNLRLNLVTGTSTKANENSTVSALEVYCGDLENMEFTITVDVTADYLFNLDVKDSEGKSLSSINKNRI